MTHSCIQPDMANNAAGAQIVAHAATTDPDPEFRAKAVFALSQSHGTDAYATILRIAQSDASDHVREQAVFALSQLQDEQADVALIALVRGHYSHKVKEQALFWLGQSGSNEALKFLDEVLTKQPAQAAKG